VGEDNGRTGSSNADWGASSNVPFEPLACCRRVQMDGASNSGGNQAGKAKQSVDSIENSMYTEKIAVGLTMP
jgi:hypothetical protein